MIGKSLNLSKYYREPLYRNSITIMLNSAFTNVFGLVFWIVGARLLSTGAIGLAAAAIAAGSLIISLSRLGLDIGLLRFVPQSAEKSALYDTVTSIVVSVAFVLTAAFLLMLPFLSPALAFLRQGTFLLAFLAYACLYATVIVQGNTMIAMRKGDLYLLQGLVLGLRIPLLLLLVSLTTLGIFISFDVTLIVTLLISAFWLYRLGLVSRFRISRRLLNEIAPFSFGNYTAGILGMLPQTVVPILIVNTVGADATAYFFVAYSLAAALSLVSSSVGMSLLVEGSHDLPIKENVGKSLRLTFAILIPLLLIMLLFGDKLLLLFGKQYSEQAFLMLQLLALSSIFLAVIDLGITVKRIQKDVRSVNLVYSSMAILIIAFGYLALLRYGLIGLGYVWLASAAFVSIYMGWTLTRI